MEAEGQQAQQSQQRSKFLLAASAASAFSVIVGSPFDSIKVRMQTKFYNSAAACVQETMKREGFRGFFRGIIPPLLTVNLVKTVSVGVYENTRMSLSNGDNNRSVIYFTSGFLAGVSTSLLSCPLELIRNQRILHDIHVISAMKASQTDAVKKSKTVSADIRKPTTFEYAKVLLKTNGIRRGLYRGFSAHFSRESLGTGIYWLIYESMHRIPLISETGRRQDANGLGRFLAGGLTGMLSWAIVFPLDLVKNVYQREASVGGSAQKYRNIGECAKAVYQRAGIIGFYQGMMPTLWRAFPIHAINLFLYEFFLDILD